MHSSKDMPTSLPAGLEISAYLPREDFRDAFIGRTAPNLMALPDGAVIGSSSLRRQALIRRRRPDISVITFRGLVETRLRKLEDGQVDATLLALAGLNRLSMPHVVTEIMNPEDSRRRQRKVRSALKAASVTGACWSCWMPSMTGRPGTQFPVNGPFLLLSMAPVARRSPAMRSARGDHLKFSGLILTPD